MKKLFTSILFAILFSSFTLVHSSIIDREGVEYISTEDLTFAWDASVGAVRYEVVATWIDPTTEFEYDLGETIETQIVVSRPRTGHFKFKVRACDISLCSDWAESTDSAAATVAGQPKGWWIFWKVPPPTDPIIE